MPRQQVRFEQFFAAPCARVFAFFADHEKFGRVWSGRTRRVRDSQDPQDVNGLGSVREIRAAGLSFEETITAYRPNELIEYRITRGSPIKNHIGRMRFKEVPGGTQLDYSIEFDPKLPLTGSLIAGLLCAGWHGGVGRAVEGITAGA